MRHIRESLGTTSSALRNLAVHAYFGVDWDIVWTTATEGVPPLLERTAAILASLPAT